MNGFTRALAALLLLAAMSFHARAWPERTVRIIVPFGPGGHPDLIGRLVADGLAKETGGTFIVENKPGAGGTLGMAQVARSAPDGHTFGLVISSHLTTNTLLYSKLPYDVRDLALVSKATTTGSVLAVSPALGVATLDELIAALKRNPDRHNYANVGLGSLSHMVGETIAARSGSKIQSITFSAAPDMLGALIRGEVTFILLPASTTVPLARAGKLKALGVTTGRRLSGAPDIPSLKELGLDIDFDAWTGFVAPAKTPAAAVDGFRGGMARALADPELRSRLAKQFVEVVGNPSSESFAAEVKAETDRWRPIIDRLNIRLD